jgi:DNA-binding transcriptional ArsR family regulator
MPHPLPDSLVEVIAERFGVLGEPRRIRIIDRSRNGEATIGELAEALHTSQQHVSKHVGILAGAGPVAREKQANSVRCRMADEMVLELREQACGGLQRQIAALQTLPRLRRGRLMRFRSPGRSHDAGGRVRPRR